jgi:hypothetical protein
VATVKWLLRGIALAIVAGAIGLGAVAITSRSDLDDGEAAVEAAWADLVPDLDARYDALQVTNDAVRDEGGGARAIVGEIDAALTDWDNARRTNRSVDAQISAANTLEGLARRLEATIAASPRFGVEPVLAAYATFAQHAVDGEVLNERVDSYADDRRGILHNVVATALGHDKVRRLDAGSDGAPDAASDGTTSQSA